jgi:hypothetical protein
MTGQIRKIVLRSVCPATAILWVLLIPLSAHPQSAGSATEGVSYREALPDSTELSQRSIGLYGDFVLTDEYDPGFGFGIYNDRRFLHKSIILSPEFNMWGASTDTTDVLVVGGGLFLGHTSRVLDDWRITWGASAGYYHREKTDRYILDGIPLSRECAEKGAEGIVSLRIERTLTHYRRLMFRVSHNITADNREFHIVLGLAVENRGLTLQPWRRKPAPIPPGTTQ